MPYFVIGSNNKEQRRQGENGGSRDDDCAESAASADECGHPGSSSADWLRWLYQQPALGAAAARLSPLAALSYGKILREQVTKLPGSRPDGLIEGTKFENLSSCHRLFRSHVK